MTCPHQSRIRDRGAFTCALGLYGGRPYLGNCNTCIQSGQNTEDYAKTLFDKAERSHPSSKAKISGCCDSAKNYEF
jgi:hypothetical protein